VIVPAVRVTPPAVETSSRVWLVALMFAPTVIAPVLWIVVAPTVFVTPVPVIVNGVVAISVIAPLEAFVACRPVMLRFVSVKPPRPFTENVPAVIVVPPTWLNVDPVEVKVIALAPLVRLPAIVMTPGDTMVTVPTRFVIELRVRPAVFVRETLPDVAFVARRLEIEALFTVIPPAADRIVTPPVSVPAACVIAPPVDVRFIWFAPELTLPARVIAPPTVETVTVPFRLLSEEIDSPPAVSTRVNVPFVFVAARVVMLVFVRLTPVAPERVRVAAVTEPPAVARFAPVDVRFMLLAPLVTAPATVSAPPTEIVTVPPVFVMLPSDRAPAFVADQLPAVFVPFKLVIDRLLSVTPAVALTVRAPAVIVPAAWLTAPAVVASVIAFAPLVTLLFTESAPVVAMETVPTVFVTAFKARPPASVTVTAPVDVLLAA
jgi:hypothetical protein